MKRSLPLAIVLASMTAAPTWAADLDFGGRLMLDAAWFDSDTSDQENDTEVRRGRLFVSGDVHEDWGFKVQYDFAGGDVSAKDVYLQHKPTGIKIGQFKAPFSLEEMISSNHITFLERAMPNILATSRRLGIGWSTSGDNYTLAAALYDREMDDGEEGPGVGARATYTPMRNEQDLLHVGASVAIEGPANAAADTSRFRARPEAHLASRLIDTGTLSDVDQVTKFGLEGAWVRGPLSLQAEYIAGTASRDNGQPDFDLSGYYLYASYFLAGDSRPYRNGAFGRVKPVAASGAWELALRYSSMDLNDGTVQGGEEDNVTVGVNYYATSHVRFMANYVFVDSSRGGIDDDPGIFQVRAQINF